MPLDRIMKTIIKSVLTNTFKLKMDDVEVINDEFTKKLSDAVDVEIGKLSIDNLEDNKNLIEALTIIQDVLVRILENNETFRNSFKNILISIKG